MNFDISKLDSLPSKAAGAKAKPKFGSSIRARPKPKPRPADVAESPAGPLSTGGSEPQAEPSQQAQDDSTRTEARDAQPAAETNNLDGATAAVREGQGTAAEQSRQPTELRQVKPISKRKAPESAGAPDAVPEAPQAPASPSDADARAMVPMDDDETATQPDTGPMTKAKKRKGLGKGAGTSKPKTPLAEQKIDPVSMPLKTVVKIACAKDKVKAAAAKAAKSAAAAAAQASSQQSSPAISPVQEHDNRGVAQMVLDPETGQLVIDPNSLTMQAQAPVQYVRRDDNDDVLINSMSHMRREASTRWTPEETEEFYVALGIFGTNFQAVADRLASRMGQSGMVSCKRSRKQVKLKFNKEERLHPCRIDATLRGQNAMPEDYIEIIHDIKASRNEVQDDEAAYIEAAPQSAAAEPHTANGSTQQLAEQDPQRLKALHSEQAGAQQQRQPVPSKAAGPSRAKPRVKAGARANKAAAAEAANAGQTAGPETANGSADPRLARLLQETNVTAEDWREEGVY